MRHFIAGLAGGLALTAGGFHAHGQSDAFAPFADRAPSPSDLDFVRSHVRFLADDHLEGRGPGTRGGDLTTRYLAAQLELLGVKPGAADGGYYQDVPLLGIKTDVAASNAEIVFQDSASAGALRLSFLDEFVACDESQSRTSDVDAEMVFVGYGIASPEQQWDDYKGVDVRGKVLLMLVNDPPSEDPKVFGGKALTYYGRWTYKYEEAARRGAVGAILMHRDDLAGYGWNVVRTSFARERPYVDARGDGTERLKLAGWLTEAKTRQVVELAGKKLDELLADAAKSEFKPVPLGLHLKAHMASRLRPLDTANVIGVVEGSRRPGEAVVFTAHHDHLGIDEDLVREGKDGIYNGAVDNATGCAALLWLARECQRLEPKPERSMVFLFTTAEEGGLRGSQYYAEHPTFKPSKIAADINLDSLVVRGEPMQFAPLGYERSTMRRAVELAAREYSVELIADARPELGLFYRSDHLNFARIGVPAINLQAGTKLKDEADDVATARSTEYTKTRYHQPSDEYDPQWDLLGVVKTARFAGRIGWRVANDAELPRFNSGDEFAKPR